MIDFAKREGLFQKLDIEYFWFVTVFNILWYYLYNIINNFFSKVELSSLSDSDWMSYPKGFNQ
jgi:hypothetical protein